LEKPSAQPLLKRSRIGHEEQLAHCSPLLSTQTPYNAFFPAAFALAHLAFAIAASFAFTAALTFLFFLAGLGAFAPLPRYLAHRALAAAAMAALPARDMRCFFLLVNGLGIPPPPPAIESILLCSFSTRLSTAICSFPIFFLMMIMLRIWSVDKSLSFVMENW